MNNSHWVTSLKKPKIELEACRVPSPRNRSIVLNFQPIGFVAQHFYEPV